MGVKHTPGNVKLRESPRHSRGFTIINQIWIAVSVYVLVAIVKKRLNLDASLYTLLQILSVALFEKMPLQQAFPGNDYNTRQDGNFNQLNLFVI
jgi:hypothetical protein